MAKILIADDELAIIEVLKKLLSKHGHNVETALDGKTALEKLKNGVFDLMITDVRMPELDGITLLKKAKELQSHIAVIVMTAYGEIADAVKAMKNGAFYYVEKPFKFDEFLLTIDRAMNYELIMAENEVLKRSISNQLHFGLLVGDSPLMLEIYRLVEKVAKTNSAVLLLGNSGTGKELIAKAVHESSPRHESPFVTINCAAMPETLLESELFGYVKGAFTGAGTNKPGLFEAAHSGTVFLDEISAMTFNMQAKLLRVLQEKEIRRVGGTQNIPIDVRVIAASNEDIEQKAKIGEFREDLYYRLSVIPIKIPPLKDRKEDIPAMISHFLTLFKKENKKDVRISPEVVESLKKHDWPGNVRELENLIKRLATLCENDTITPDDLPPQFPRTKKKGKAKPIISLDEFLENQTAAYMKEVLAQCGGDYSKAAQITGKKPTEIKRKIKNIKKGQRK